MVNNPIHLTILRRGDVNIVDMAEVQAIIPRGETRVEQVFLDEIGQELKRITNLVGPEFRKGTQAGDSETRRNPRVVGELKNVGSLIFSHLLPQAARDRLRSSESCNLYLRLDDQLIDIPWELAFDGQQFLGMKFRVGRQVITHHRVSQAAPARAAADILKVLIISDPSETLKNVSRESEELCEMLDAIPGFHVKLIGGRGVRRIPLLAALRESDVVHFAGHSKFDERNPENSGWLLYDGLLSASEISKLDQAPLLVFSNSCQAGATKNWQSEYLFEGEAFGLGSAFLLAGVSNYIGTFYVVHDEESRFLAVEFYRRIGAGQTIGQALLEARLATAEQMGLERLTWASYMLYGDPDCTLSLPPKVQFEPIKSVSATHSSDAQIQPVPLANVQPRRWRIKWPRLNLKISISISVAMLAVLVFGHILRTQLLLQKEPLRRLPESPKSLRPPAEPPPSMPPNLSLQPTPDRSSAVPQVLEQPRRAVPTQQQQPPQMQRQQQQHRQSRIAGSSTIQDHLNVGRSLRERGDYAGALAAFEKARSLDPGNAEVVSELEATRKACNAERQLNRADLNCS